MKDDCRYGQLFRRDVRMFPLMRPIHTVSVGAWACPRLRSIATRLAGGDKPTSLQLSLLVILSATLFFLSGCGPTVNQMKPQQAVTVNQQFQKQLTPIPTVPRYRCGAWASNNMPGAYSWIIIYARLTKESASGFTGVAAQAVVHFKSGDVPLDQQPTSDKSGYVTFNLPLAGRQPLLVPATVDITFYTQGSLTTCTAFFTPQ